MTVMGTQGNKCIGQGSSQNVWYRIDVSDARGDGGREERREGEMERGREEERQRQTDGQLTQEETQTSGQIAS